MCFLTRRALKQTMQTMQTMRGPGSCDVDEVGDGAFWPAMRVLPCLQNQGLGPVLHRLADVLFHSFTDRLGGDDLSGMRTLEQEIPDDGRTFLLFIQTKI